MTNRQHFASIAANLIIDGIGFATGWVSLSLPLLQSDATPLETGKLTISEISWVGSVVAIGAIVGNCLCEYIVTKIGTRNTIFLIGFPQLISWFFLIFGTCPMHLVISRFLSGTVSGGAQTCVFLFVDEITENELEGQFGTIFIYARNTGILIAFMLGSYFDYVTSSKFFTGITVLFLVAIWFIPSTPQYFLKKNNIEAADRSFKFYNKHRLVSDPKLCTIMFESLKESAHVVKSESKVTWKDIVNSRHGFWQAFVLALLNILTAQFIFLTYGSLIIERSGTFLSPEGSSIFMGVVQVVATFVTYKLIDTKGRKFLLILSLAGCAVSHAIMVAYLSLNQSGYGDGEEGSLSAYTSIVFHLTPILCMSSVILMSSIGIVALCPICTAEGFPDKIRSMGMNFGNIVLNIFAFMLYKMYPLFEESIGLSACLMIFCGSCTLGTIYVAAFLEDPNALDSINGSTGMDDESRELNDEPTERNYEAPDIHLSSLRKRSMHARRRSSYRINRFDARKYSVITIQI